MNLLFMQNGLPPYGIPRNGLIAIFDPGRQILTGTTGQTAIDFSGHGNTFQLGSAAGADTNDPAFSGAGLVFGTDDYCKSSSSVFDDLPQFTCITVCKPLSAGGGSAGRIFSKGSNFEYLITSNYFRLWIGREGTTTDVSGLTPISYLTPLINCISYNKLTPSILPKIFTNITKHIVSGTAGAGNLTSDASIDLYIGNRATADRNFDGTIYLQVWYNRILTDAEYMQSYNGLRRLMSARGVVI